LSVPAVIVPIVKQVVKVRLLPTEVEAAMRADKVRGKHDVQKRFYVELKQRFGLSAQPAIRMIGKVAEAYASLRANIAAGNHGPPGSERRNKVSAKPIEFRGDAAQPFDARYLSWQIPGTVGGREATVSF
jgi:putative transposase